MTDDDPLWLEDYRFFRSVGMTHDEIARSFGIKKTTLEKRLERLKEKENL